MEQNIFIAIYGFLAFFSGLYGLTESWFFRFGLKDLFPLHTLDIKVDFNRSKWWRHKHYKGHGSERVVLRSVQGRMGWTNKHLMTGH